MENFLKVSILIFSIIFVFGGDKHKTTSDTNSAHNETKSAHNETKSAHNETKSAHSETKSAHSETKSGHNETKSAQNETTMGEAPSGDVEPQSNVDKIKSGLKGIWTDFFTKHFYDKYKKLEDFFSSSKKDLMNKVEDTEKYISIVEERQKELLLSAKNDTVEAAKSVQKTLNDWLQDVSTFKEKVQDSAKSEYNDLSNAWEKKMTDKWNGGLETVIALSKKAKLDETDHRNLITSLNVTTTN